MTDSGKERGPFKTLQGLVRVLLYNRIAISPIAHAALQCKGWYSHLTCRQLFAGITALVVQHSPERICNLRLSCLCCTSRAEAVLLYIRGGSWTAMFRRGAGLYETWLTASVSAA